MSNKIYIHSWVETGTVRVIVLSKNTTKRSTWPAFQLARFEILCFLPISFLSFCFSSTPWAWGFCVDVSGWGEGENPELGLVSGSSSSSSSGGSLKDTSSSSFSSPPLDDKLKSRLFSVDYILKQKSIKQSINNKIVCWFVLWLAYSSIGFVCFFVRSLHPSFVSFIRAFTILSFARSFLLSFTCLFVHSFDCWKDCSFFFIYLFYHSFNYSFSHRSSVTIN